MQYLSLHDRGNHVPRRWEKVEEDLQGRLSLCCWVVEPLRDSDLVTNFYAASFCVAFFFSSPFFNTVYIEKLTHLVHVITLSNVKKRKNEDM